MAAAACAVARRLFSTVAYRGAKRRDVARALARPGRKKVLRGKLHNRTLTGPEILNLMNEHVGTEAFDPRNISMAFFSLGFKSFGTRGFSALRNDTQFERLCHAATESIERQPWTPPLLSRLLWGLTKVPRTAATDALFVAAARAIPTIAGDAKLPQIANIAWAFATSDIEAPEVFDALRTAVEAYSAAELRRSRDRDLSIALWAFAKVGAPAPAMFDRFATEILSRDLAAFNDQSLSNTAWAFATSRHAAPPLFSAIAREMTGRIRECAPVTLVMTLWAFARMNAPAPALFALVAADAPRFLECGETRSVSQLSWAFATAGVDAPAFFASAEREALKRGLANMNGQSISNLAWAFCKAGIDAPALYAAVAEELALPRRARSLNMQGEFILFTVTCCASPAHSLTRSP